VWTSDRLPRTLRRFVVGGFYIVLAFTAAAVAFTILVAIGFRFGGSTEFEDLPGSTAQLRLENDWPVSVDPSAVPSMSYKGESTFDSYSRWYRIRLDEVSAAKWTDDVHTKRKLHAMEVVGHKETLEGVRRTVPGPPSLRRQTGTTPSWWSPPQGDYRATEIMKWYAWYDSGIGWGIYTYYDRSTEILWIYDYCCQHDKFWSAHHVPQGEAVFGKNTVNPRDADQPSGNRSAEPRRDVSPKQTPDPSRR
jgi:hypothetical protein